MAFEMWNGSVCVVVATGMIPTLAVSGADTGGDQNRVEPAERLGPFALQGASCSSTGGAVSPRSCTKSSPAHSASWISPTQYLGPKTSRASTSASRHDGGVPAHAVESHGEVRRRHRWGPRRHRLKRRGRGDAAPAATDPSGVCEEGGLPTRAAPSLPLAIRDVATTQ